MKKYFFYLSLLFSFMMVNPDIANAYNISIEGSKGKLNAEVNYPAEVMHDVKYPLVILCHGFSGNSNEKIMKTLADDIVKEGMAVLRFDFNGHGKSEGEFKDMTVPNEIEDLMKVISWAQNQPWVESISLVGHSQGGVVAGMTAGILGDAVIKAEVLMAPAAVLRDDALRGNTMGALYNPWDIQGEFVELPHPPGTEPLLLGKEYIQTAIVLPIYETSRKYEGPALILHGTHDFVVPYTYGERYNTELKNSTLKLIDGDDHGFYLNMDETCAFVAEWLKSILNPLPVDPVKI